MFTREQYMNNEITHDQYYGQFVDDGIIALVKSYIGEDRIKNSNDRVFNDIPIEEWDAIPVTPRTHDKFKDANDYVTAAGYVCVLKKAANQIRKGS